MEWVQHVYFQEELITDVITIEGDTLDKTDVPNEGDFSLEYIAAVADCKGMLDG